MKKRSIYAIALCMSIGYAGAQSGNVPPHVLAKVKETGAVLNPAMVQAMFDLYAPMMPKPAPGVMIIEDLAYGPNERHRLDVFAPAARPAQTLPVVMFVHGGGYVGGGKSRPGVPFYQNVGDFFARNGAIGINMTYRLAPAHPWPAGGEDVAAALRWVRRNIAEFGGDPGRIFLFGQSAGGTHVAHYVFDEQLQPPDGGDGVAGAILQSAVFDPAGAPPGPNVPAYFGSDRGAWAERSLFGKIGGRRIPVFILYAEYDPPEFKRESAKLRDALCKRDTACPRAKELAGHNHLSEILHLNTQDASMGPELLSFVRETR